jgi:hypothetical protein
MRLAISPSTQIETSRPDPQAVSPLALGLVECTENFIRICLVEEIA